MNTLTLVLGLLAVVMVGVAWQARRLGNEQRDVAFLAVTAGVLGAGSAVSAAL